MRSIKTVAAIVVVALIAVVGVFGMNQRSVSAQDSGKIVCDADLVRSWYIAEYYFNFNNIVLLAEDMGSAEANLAMIDLTQFEQGQFAPLFAMLAESRAETAASMVADETMVAEALLMSEEELDAMTEAMLPAANTETDPAVLFSPVIENDPVECQALRAELRHFYSALLYANVMMGGE